MIKKQYERWLAQLPEQPNVEVYPENIDAWRVLRGTEMQWERPGAFGGQLRLQLTEVRACIDGLAIEDPVDCFERVLVLIRHAIPALTERFKQSAKR